MNFLVASTSRYAFRFSTTRSPLTISLRNFSIGDELAKKKKVEEDRYIREQERKFFEKKKAELEKKLVEEHLKIFESTIAPAMAEVEMLLSKSGDKVSEDGLELLAKWKMGIKFDE